MMIQVSLGLLLFVIGVSTGYPVRYRQPVQYLQHAPSSEIQYQYVPVQHHSAPARYHHSPAQYQHQPQPHYQLDPVAYPKIDPLSHEEAAAESHGEHGHHSSGHIATGHSDYADKLAHADAASSTHGHHNLANHADHGSHGANNNYHGTYSNVGSYSQDKGSGFEKSYSFDRSTGYHDIEVEDSGSSQSHGTQTKEAHHNTGAHSTHGHEKTGAHSSTGSNEHSTQAHNKSLFQKYGYTHGGKQQGYSYSPLYGYGYH